MIFRLTVLVLFEQSFRHKPYVKHDAPQYLPLVRHNRGFTMLSRIISNTMGTKYKYEKNNAPSIMAWIIRRPWELRYFMDQHILREYP
jgi:hypothetical protein